jgi:hypothetical protein
MCSLVALPQLVQHNKEQTERKGGQSLARIFFLSQRRVEIGLSSRFGRSSSVKDRKRTDSLLTRTVYLSL